MNSNFPKSLSVICLFLWLTLFSVYPSFGQVFTVTDNLSTFGFSCETQSGSADCAGVSPFGVAIGHPVPSPTEDDSTLLWYVFTDDFSTSPPTAAISLHTSSIGIGEAYLSPVSFGEVFSGGGPAFDSAPIGEEFYLGIEVQGDFGGADGGPLFDPGIGWAKFLIDPATLEPSVLESSIVYGGNGPVLIGVTTVPEPSGAVALGIIASVLGLRRRSRSLLKGI